MNYEAANIISKTRTISSGEIAIRNKILKTRIVIFINFLNQCSPSLNFSLSKKASNNSLERLASFSGQESSFGFFSIFKMLHFNSLLIT